MEHARTIVTAIERPDAADVAAMRRHTVAAIADVAGHEHVLPPELVAVTPGLPLCGPVHTCLGVDVLVRRAAIDLAQPGDVVLVAGHGRTYRSCFGAATAEHMRARGIAGIVVDGAVRDVAELRRLGFPTYARGITPANYRYPAEREQGGVNVPVLVAGHRINPGDLIAADDDGVLALPRHDVHELAGKVTAAVTAEDVKWARRRGADFGAVDLLRAEGYQIHGSMPGRQS